MRVKILIRATLIFALCLLTVSTIHAKRPDPVPDPETPSTATTTVKYGYAMFRDAYGDAIVSDNGTQYIDCNIRGEGGEDRVQIGILKDGSLDWVKFYPGRMYYHYPNFPPSSRSVKFNFDIAGSVTLGYNDGPHEAVHEILKYQYPDCIGDGILHVPITVNGQNNDEFSPLPYDDLIQFAMEPDAVNHGSDPMAVTLPKVNDLYPDDPEDLIYWDTTGMELDPYIIYHIVFEGDDGSAGFEGFKITEIDHDRKGKPITWLIAPSGPMKLCVATPDWQGDWIELTTYDSLTFEFAVSLVPFAKYPLPDGAPPKKSSISTVWGDMKER